QAHGRPYLVAKTQSATPTREVENRRAKQKEIEEERRKKKAAERATQSVTRAKAVEARARAAWERAKRELAAAELALSSHQRSGSSRTPCDDASYVGSAFRRSASYLGSAFRRTQFATNWT